MALSAQEEVAADAPFESAEHFFMKEVFAAPASAFPFFPMALSAHEPEAEGAAAGAWAKLAGEMNMLVAKAAEKARAVNLVMVEVSL